MPEVQDASMGVDSAQIFHPLIEAVLQSTLARMSNCTDSADNGRVFEGLEYAMGLIQQAKAADRAQKIIDEAQAKGNPLGEEAIGKMARSLQLF